MKATLETMSVEELLQLRSHQMLSVNAEYQRGAVWSAAQKKRLIDSVLRGYQIPLFYLHHIKRAVAGFQNMKPSVRFRHINLTIGPDWRTFPHRSQTIIPM